MEEPLATAETVPTASEGWLAWLALNASTGALLAAILLVGMSSELYEPLLPQYMKGLAAPLVVIALYGSACDLLDAINFYLGGALAARFNTRRALLVFNTLPIVGLVLLLVWPRWYAIFVALPFLGVWNSIAGPATLRVVGDTLAAHRRSMAFSLQSIQKRLSSIVASALSGGLVVWFGKEDGVRAAIVVAIAFVLLSVVVQFHYMRTAVTDPVRAHHQPLALLRRFDPQLRRLLASEIFTRWCEAVPRELVILYCVPILAPLLRTSPDQTGEQLEKLAVAFYVGVLLNVRDVTSLLIYLPVGHWSSRAGGAKKPFIALTFVFFALFPLLLVTIGQTGIAGLIACFVVAGLREFGEPARKALITELVPHDCRTQAIGIYWSARGFGIAPAAVAGGLVWYFLGPQAMLYTAAAFGVVGAVLFFLKFSAER